MASARPPPEHALYETVPAPTIHASGIAEITATGHGMVCVVLYLNVPTLDPNDPGIERQVAGRLYVPAEAIPAAIRQIMAFIDCKPADAAQMMLS
jgi:hypothetical protein